MKGTVYGGVLHLPAHPVSDIHGLVRAVIRTSSRLRAEENLEAIGVPNPSALWRNGIWSESRSAVELLVTETHYGKLLVCPLDAAYVTAEKYRPLSKEYFQSQLSAGTDKTTVVGSKTGSQHRES